MTDLILPLEKQVSTLESSKILKELGVPQRSLFYWADVSNVKGNPGHKCVILNGNCDKLENYSAFTVAELGELLKGFQLPEYTAMDGWGDCNANMNGNTYGSFNTEAEARAKMLIYLRKNKLIEVPK